MINGRYRSLLVTKVTWNSQYVHPKHPPDKEDRDDGPRDVNHPVASSLRFSKIEHAAMVAGPRELWRGIAVALIDPMLAGFECNRLARLTSGLSVIRP